MLTKFRKRMADARRNVFARSVGVLVGGTAFSQVLAVLILPVLTRMYSPADFAVLAVYASILGIFGSVACLRLEIAIPLPEADDEAFNLLVLSLSVSAFLSAVLALLVFFFPIELALLTGQAGFARYLWLLPLGVWLYGSYAALQFWATRKKQFSMVAKTRVGQAIGGAGVQLGFGWFEVAPFGLLFGHLVSSGAGVFGIGVNAWAECRKLILKTRPRSLLVTLHRYGRFPKYSAPEALANNGAIQIPIIVIATWAAGPEAGFVMLATRVMAAPMSLIGNAVSQVYLSRAPEEMRQGRLGDFTSTVLSGLFKMGVPPLVSAGILAPLLFPLVFGGGWGRAGDIVSWMTPWFVMQFISTPVSMILHVVDRQKTALLLQVLGFFLRVGVVVMAAAVEPSVIVEVYAISGFVFYLIYFILILRVANIGVINLLRMLRAGWPYFVVWLLVVGVVYSVLSN